MRLKYIMEITTLDDDFIAIPIVENKNDFNGVIKMNQTSADILNLLKEEITESEIVDVLEKKYDISHDVIASDVHECLSQFQEKGLLV